MKIVKHIPNALTLSNLFCGSLACILIVKSNGYIYTIIILMCLSLIFDFFDGFIARLTKSNGELGKQLDSLADMITFGLLPGIIMIKMLELSSTPIFYPLERGYNILYVNFLKYLGLIITLASAYRLAKFNIDEDQSYYFKGLPTPANAFMILSLFYIQLHYNFNLMFNFWFLLGIILIFSYLPVSNIPLFALKFKSFSLKDNKLIFSFIGISVILLIFLKIAAIPIIILLYIIVSLIFRKKIVSNGAKTT